MPEFHSPKHGDWFWHELTTSDAEAATRFYGAVLGWTTESQVMPSPAGDFTYRLIKRPGDGGMLGGIMHMEGPMWDGIPPHWMVYMSVDDVDRAKSEVEANGGQVKVGPHDIPGTGRFIVCTDPQGAVFTLMQPAPEMGGPQPS